MRPYHKYVIVSLLRGKTPKDILRSLRNTKLAKNIRFSEYNRYTNNEKFDEDKKIVAKITTPLQVNMHQEMLASYSVLDYFTAKLSDDNTWSQLWDIISVRAHKVFIVTLLTARYSPEDITPALNKKFSTAYTPRSVRLFKHYFWDLDELSIVEVVDAVDDIQDNQLRKALYKIIDGNKGGAFHEVQIRKAPVYTDMLGEILADAYAKYNELKDKTDPKSMAELKVWLDVIVKIGDRHNKNKPKESNELDVLLDKLTIEKKNKDEIMDIDSFLDKNKMA